MDESEGFESFVPSMRKFAEIVRRELAAAQRDHPQLVLDPNDNRAARLLAVTFRDQGRGKNVN